VLIVLFSDQIFGATMTKSSSDTKIKVALVISNRQYIRSWIDSGLIDKLLSSGLFEITLFAPNEIFKNLPPSIPIESKNLGQFEISKYSKHVVAMSYVAMRSKSSTFRFKLARQFLPETKFFASNIGLPAAIKLFFHSTKRLLGNTRDNWVTLLYFIKPLRSFLYFYFNRMQSDCRLPIEIQDGKFDWLIMPASSAVGISTDFLAGAKNIGLKTLMAIDNWDHLTGKSVYPIKPDFFTVMGTNDVKHAVAIHDCDPKSILPFGLPRFDVYRRPINSPVNLNIATKKKILYCGFSLAHSEKRIVDQIANFMDDKYGEGAVEVCYRPHPGPLARYDNYEIRNERVDITKHGNLDRTAMPDMDQKFIDVLMSSDVVVGAPTTLLLEAMLLGKTCVLDVTLDGFHRTTAGNSARRHTHMLDLLAVTSLPRGKSVTELISTIDSSLQNSMNYKNYEISHLYNVSDKPFDIQLLGFLTRNAEPLNAIG
jgi:hypothetical protein